MQNFSYNDFVQYTSVSRETFLRLQDYVELLKKWQEKINLVAKASLKELWTRHIIDSAQLNKYIVVSDKAADMGSGAGFPGLVLGIMGNKNITLVESDTRKIAFLREAARITNTEITIQHSRAEDVELKNFSVVTARGFAPLKALLEVIGGTLNVTHKLLLLKGKNYKSEIEDAKAFWSFDYSVFPSITDSDAVVLSLHNFKRTGVL